MKNILIITEANEKVATGHLFECLVLYEELKNRSKSVSLMVNRDLPEKMISRLDEDTIYYSSNIQNEYSFLKMVIIDGKYNTLVFNLRDLKNDLIKQIRGDFLDKVQIISIDEFGHKYLDVDIIINPMIGKEYWEYDNFEGQLYCGMDYLILPPRLCEYHDRIKQISEKIEVITISMGGVDLYGTTLKVVKWLREKGDYRRINVVLGAGFSYKDELDEIIDGAEGIYVYQNIDFIYDLFFESDLAICAGGNTLHELAAIGTPTIIIPTMPHEVDNAIAFESKGFGISTVIANSMNGEDIANAFYNIGSFRVRSEMALLGKRISEGLGYKKVFGCIV